MSVALDQVTRIVDGLPAIRDVSLTLENGRLAVLLGPTLSGKTSIMRLLAGLNKPNTGRVLVDGGTTNPLPFDGLTGRADIVVAVDLFSAPGAERTDMPSTWECVYSTILVMGGAIVAAKLAHAAPDLVIAVLQG